MIADACSPVSGRLRMRVDNRSIPVAVDKCRLARTACVWVEGAGSSDLGDVTGECLVEDGVEPARVLRESGSAVDYTDMLRRLAINDEHFTGECVSGSGPRCGMFDPKTLALARIAALVAVGAAGPSYRAEADAAVSAGATAAEIVDVLVGIVSVVGLPCVVVAAPPLAMALGYDVDAALEQLSGE